MKLLLRKLAGLGVLVCLSHGVAANLIVNGSFEDNNVKSGKWSWFTADKVNGWDGSNIEIWDNLLSINAFDGSQIAELNSHGSNKSIFNFSDN
jgi:hypothetical protein